MSFKKGTKFIVFGGFALLFVDLIPLGWASPITAIPTESGLSTPTASLTGSAPSLQFTQYAESRNGSTNLRFSNTTPGLATLDVPVKWQTSATNLTVSNLQENRSWVGNTDSNDSQEPWMFCDNSSALYSDVNTSAPWYDQPITATEFYPSAGGWANAYNRTASFITLNGTLDCWQGNPLDPLNYNWYYDYYAGLSAYFERNLTVPRGDVTAASLECDICLNGSDWIHPFFEIYFAVVVNNASAEYVIAQTDFGAQTSAFESWQHLRFDVDPTIFNLTANNTVFFRYGLGVFRAGSLGVCEGLPEFDVYNNNVTVPQAPNQTVYFDNVNLYLQTRANPSDVNLSIIVGNASMTVTDVNWSQGSASWAVSFPTAPSDLPSALAVQFDTNWTDCILDWDLEVNATTTAWVTIQPVDPDVGIGVNYRGLTYTATSGQPVTWDFYLYSQIPFQWQNQYQIWMNISPEWTIVSVKSPDFKQLANSISGGYPGDGLFRILPGNITGSGFWTIEARSPNYNLTLVNGGGTDANTSIGPWVPGVTANLALNLTHDTGLPTDLAASIANLSVVAPNGSLFFTDSVTSSVQGIATFHAFSVGAQNTSIGAYLVSYCLTNGTAVGFNATTVIVQHASEVRLVLPANYVPGHPILALWGSSLALRVELWDKDAGIPVSGEQLVLHVGGSTYVFTEVALGVYDLMLDSSQLAGAGSYNCTISASGAGVTATPLVIMVDFAVPQTLTWILAGAAAAAACITGVVVAWVKVVVPRRQRIYREMLEYTSTYYDAHALVGYMVLNKLDGICIYDQWQDLADRSTDANLISGFLTAITAFSEEIPVTKEIEDMRDERDPQRSPGEVPHQYRTMTLDYENFVIILQDGEFCRAAAIFAMHPSEFFAQRIAYFMQEFESIYRSFLENFGGSIAPFQEAGKFFDKYVHFALTRPLEINLSTKAKKLQKDILLTEDEQWMMNVIQALLQEKDYVRVRTAVKLYATTTEAAETAAIKGVLGLWYKNMLLPVDPAASIETALRFFSEEDAEILAVLASGVRDPDQLALATDLTREGVEAKLQSFRAWKLVNLQDTVTEKGYTILERRQAKLAEICDEPPASPE